MGPRPIGCTRVRMAAAWRAHLRMLCMWVCVYHAYSCGVCACVRVSVWVPESAVQRKHVRTSDRELRGMHYHVLHREEPEEAHARAHVRGTVLVGRRR